MKKLMFAVATATLGVAVNGDVCTWKASGNGFWADATRWENGKVPVAGDSVCINACTGVVTMADATTLAGVTAISLVGPGSGLVISNDVADGDFEFAKPVSGEGVIVKRGDGITKMTYLETAEKTGFYTTNGLEVADGVLMLPRSPKTDLYLAKVTVSDPGIFVHTGVMYTWVEQGIWGNGTISNDVSKPLYLGGGTADNPAIFSGKLVHLAYPCMRDGDGFGKYQYFTGIDSSNTKGPLNYAKDGVMGVMKIGNTKENASVSSGSIALAYRGLRTTFRYLGTGETANRQIILGTNARNLTFDAGETGNLTLTGSWIVDPDEANYMNVLTLLGNGDNVFGGNFSTVTNPLGENVGLLHSEGWKRQLALHRRQDAHDVGYV